MARAFLDYTKTILKKVSFNADLFQTELTKAIARLLPYEVFELKQWILEQFKDEPQLKPCLVRVKQIQSKF
ncbi:MAG: hypothetical protein ABFR62_13535 [Bacteroidota bacterium]